MSDTYRIALRAFTHFFHGKDTVIMEPEPEPMPSQLLGDSGPVVTAANEPARRMMTDLLGWLIEGRPENEQARILEARRLWMEGQGTNRDG